VIAGDQIFAMTDPIPASARQIYEFMCPGCGDNQTIGAPA
jgi:hypothetical protein